MTIDIYPAKLVDKTWENVVPMEGDDTRLKKEAMDPAFEGEAFEPNPEYYPHSSLNMCAGNFYAIMDLIGIDLHADDSGSVPIPLVFRKTHEYLYSFGSSRIMEEYVQERVFQLREMARLGITRGATHLAWA